MDDVIVFKSPSLQVVERSKTRRLDDYPSPRSFSTISASEGNRPSSFLEKSFRLSALTTKIPPAPRTSSDSMPRERLISAARLAARGR
jgi:hypothetical protein